MAAFERYTPRTAQLAVKLDSNEHAYGLPPEIGERILARVRELELHRYPDAQQAGLRRRLARYTGQPVERIVVGNGGDELLQLLACALRRRCAQAVVTPPTFIFFRLAARLAGLPVTRVPLGSDFAFDGPGLLAVLEGRSWSREAGDGWDAEGDEPLFFLCSPNNPTGNLCPRELVEALLDRGAWVLVDEAYGEFAGETVADLLDAYPRLMILRTLSKAFALAGARVGYLLAAPPVAGAVDALRQPYNVSLFGQAAAETVLDHRDQLEALWGRICQHRKELYGALVATPGVSPYPSRANFILFRVEDPARGLAGEGGAAADPGAEAGADPAERVWLALRQREISVRNVTQKTGLAGHLRVTVGSRDQNERFLGALQQVLAAPGEEPAGETAAREEDRYHD